MTYKRKYLYNDPDSGISDKRFSELVRLGETVCRTHMVDFVNNPEYFYGKIDNLKAVVLSMAPTFIGISIKSSKNDKIRAIEEKIVQEAAMILFEEFCAFAVKSHES